MSRSGTTHSGLDPPTLIINKERARRFASSQTLTCVKVTNHKTKLTSTAALALWRTSAVLSGYFSREFLSTCRCTCHLAVGAHALSRTIVLHRSDSRGVPQQCVWNQESFHYGCPLVPRQSYHNFFPAPLMMESASHLRNH